MNKIATSTFFALLSATVAFSACSKEEKKSPEVPATKAQKAVPPQTASEAPNVAPQATKNFAAGMMKSYEKCRALLAADSSEGIVDCAKGIVEASKSAHASAPDAAHEHIGTLVKAAEALAATPMDDIEQVRVAFGDVSKSVVAMLTAAPEAGKEYHVFECPMAKGYKRWAQPGAALENPYMGGKMLSCGSEVHDHHKGMMHEEGKAASANPAHGDHDH